MIDMAEWVIISLSLDQCITQNKFGAILRKMLFLWSDAKGIHFGAAFETLNIWSWWNILLYMMINLTFSSAILNDNLYICRKLKICKKFHKISRQIISFQDVSGFFFFLFSILRIFRTYTTPDMDLYNNIKSYLTNNAFSMLQIFFCKLSFTSKNHNTQNNLQIHPILQCYSIFLKFSNQNIK